MKSERKMKQLKAAAWDARSAEVDAVNTCETAWKAYLSADACESAWDAYESAWDAYEPAYEALCKAVAAVNAYKAEDK